MMDIDEIYDELEDLGIKYSAHEVSQAVEGINWKINQEDIPLCVAGLLLNKVQLTNIQLITYDEGEFTEWLENDQTKFDGGYQVIDHTGTTRYFGWNYGGGRIKELFIQKKVIFTTKKPMTESKKPTKKKLNEHFSSVEEEDDAVEKFCILMNWEVEPEDVLHCVKNIDGTFTLQISDGTQFTYDPVNDCLTESKKPVKKNLKEDVGGCFYVIHERPIGHKGYQGWIDEYGELTSDPDSAEHYDTLQEAVDMLYAIEDYVENFNDGEGIRATIQCVNPDADQVVGDMVAVDIRKRWGSVDCEVVLGEQNLINCGYLVKDSGPSMGYNQ